MEFRELLIGLVLIWLASEAAGEGMERIGQTAVLGELLAGVLIGPGVLGLVHESEVLHAVGTGRRGDAYDVRGTALVEGHLPGPEKRRVRVRRGDAMLRVPPSCDGRAGGESEVMRWDLSGRCPSSVWR